MSAPINPATKTLRDAFDNLSPHSARVHVASDKAIAGEAKKEAGIIEWAAASSMVPYIAELLNVPLPDLLTRFWQQLDKVAAEIEASKTAPGKRSVTLLETTTEATYDPKLEIRLNGVEPGKKIGFKVVTPLTIKGAVLIIERGQIVEIAAGECVIKGAIKLGSLTVAELKQPFVVPLA